MENANIRMRQLRENRALDRERLFKVLTPSARPALIQLIEGTEFTARLLSCFPYRQAYTLPAPPGTEALRSSRARFDRSRLIADHVEARLAEGLPMLQAELRA